MKMLPEVPTPEMGFAGFDASKGTIGASVCGKIYQAMYAAAPEVKDEPVGRLAHEAADRIEQLEQQLKNARNDALEEAAVIVDNIEPIDCNGLSIQDIAETIRAVKGK